MSAEVATNAIKTIEKEALDDLNWEIEQRGRELDRAYQSFEDWAGDYGYDPDSRKAEKVYRACQKLCSDLVGLLGKDTVEALVYETERL